MVLEGQGRGEDWAQGEFNCLLQCHLVQPFLLALQGLGSNHASTMLLALKEGQNGNAIDELELRGCSASLCGAMAT